MTDALIEKVEMMLFINQDESPRDKAAAVVFTVLEFYSEPGNVTDDMAAEMLIVMDAMRPAKASIAAAMRAARDEVSRG